MLLLWPWKVGFSLRRGALAAASTDVYCGPKCSWDLHLFDLRKCTTCMLRHSADLAPCLIRPEALCSRTVCLPMLLTLSISFLAAQLVFFCCCCCFTILAFQRFHVCPLELPVNTVACCQLVYTTFCRRRGPFIETNSSCIWVHPLSLEVAMCVWAWVHPCVNVCVGVYLCVCLSLPSFSSSLLCFCFNRPVQPPTKLCDRTRLLRSPRLQH